SIYISLCSFHLLFDFFFHITHIIMYSINHPTGPPAYEMVLTHYLFEQFLSFFLQRLVIYHHIVLITPSLFDNNQSPFLTEHLLFPIPPLSSLILLKLFQT